MPGHEPAGQRPADAIVFDDPEQEEWFGRLPEAAKTELRHAWADEEARSTRREELAKSTLYRSMAQGVMLFFTTETVCNLPTLWNSLASIPVGLAVGALWHRIGAGRFRCILTSVGPFFVLRIIFAFGRSGMDLAVYLIAGMIGLLMLISVAALIGFVREQRRAEDLDY